MLVRGDKLTPQARAEVLAAFGYRWTSDNDRRESWWAKVKGKPTIPLVTDEQWLRDHSFYIRADGRLNNTRRHAEPHYLADGV